MKTKNEFDVSRLMTTRYDCFYTVDEFVEKFIGLLEFEDSSLKRIRINVHGYVFRDGIYDPYLKIPSHFNLSKPLAFHYFADETGKEELRFFLKTHLSL